jgi:acyl carrier protein
VARVLAAPVGNRRAVLFDGLHAAAARALALATADEIDPRTPLTELGLDSLMAVQLRDALAAELARPLPATLLFSYPTLDDLTDFLVMELGAAEANRPALSVAATMRADLDDMDESAMANLLERKLRHL